MDQRQTPTIYGVAELAEVSVRTVSRYLNNPSQTSAKTSKLIDAAMAQLGFRPSRAARMLKGGDNALIGIVSDRITTSPDSFELINGLQMAAAAANKHLLIMETGGDEAMLNTLLGEMIEHRVNSLIYASHFHKPIPASSLARVSNLRVVTLNCYVRSRSQSVAVLPDDEQGAFEGMNYLYRMGHSRVAVFELFEGMQATILRRKGCLKAAQSAKKKDKLFFTQGSELIAGGDEFPTIDTKIEQTLRQHKPTAIFAGNDKMAARIIQCLHRQGLRVPEDISVLGFDDHPMLVQATEPPLTSVRLPYRQMGQIAAELALGGDSDKAVRVACEVVERASVAPPGR